ncbi:MAG: hypothetical protein PHF37_08960, partial [Phycisphaerae bacterium]|nr:hypothetical protein [Phycisphaerae bacterium]
PELYRGPTKRLRVKDHVKLFYFAKNNSVDQLVTLLTQQFSQMQTDPAGVTTYTPNYAVSLHQATNQLVIDAPNDVDADEILDFLEIVDVPPIQVNIDCIILQRFADVTMDWETTLLVENLLGEGITLGEGKYPNPVFPGASLRESKRSTFGLDFGYWHNQGVDGHQIRTVVDVLISRGYLKVLMNPTLETVNGKPAKVTSKEYVPLEKILVQPGFDTPFSLTEYQWVEDSLEVTPHVYADGSIGLETKAQIGSKSQPEGVVQASIVTERNIQVAENRIDPGKSLIIGGIRKSEKRAVVRGVPFLKDIPIIGILFSSKDYEEKAIEIVFILTPSISSGGITYDKMAEAIRQKHSSPKYKPGLQETITDPFGATAYTSYMEQKATEAEYQKLKAEIEKAGALDEVSEAKSKLLEKAEELLAEKQRASQAVAAAQKAKEQAEKADQTAQKLQQEAEQAKQEADAAKQEADRQTQKALEAKNQAAEAEKSRLQTQTLKEEEARQAKEEAQQAKLEAEQQAQKAEQAARLAQKADQARREAESAKLQAEEHARRALEAQRKALEEAQRLREQQTQPPVEQTDPNQQQAPAPAEPADPNQQPTEKP